MEAWTIDRYERPRLATDTKVEVIGQSIEIQRGQQRRSIRCEDDQAARDIAQLLSELRDGQSPRWSKLAESPDRRAWMILLQRLDQWSLIEDSVTSEGARLALKCIDLETEQCTRDFAAEVRARTGCSDGADLKRVAREWLGLIDDDPAAAGAWTDHNFYRGAARLMIARLADANPPAHRAMLDGLRALGNCKTGAAGPRPTAAGCFDARAMRVHGSAVADFFVRSLGAAANRTCRSSSARAEAVPGTLFQHDCEAALRAHAEALGESAFTRAIRRVSSARDPLMVGCHVEEYHVTRRFVEMITPLMSRDLAPPLRTLVYRYFAEEVGHERFERETCLACGVDATLLESACPLPLHVAFVDAFTWLAASDPVAFFVAVPITEGMLGEAHPVNQALDALDAADARFRSLYWRHQQLNIELNHSSIVRIALEQVSGVGAAQQQFVLDALAFMFELNFRAWGALTDHYGPQDRLELPKAFPAASRSGAAA